MDDWPTERESMPRGGGLRRLSNGLGQFENFCCPPTVPWFWIRVGYRNLSYLPPDMEEKQGFWTLLALETLNYAIY